MRAARVPLALVVDRCGTLPCLSPAWRTNLNALEVLLVAGNPLLVETTRGSTSLTALSEQSKGRAVSGEQTFYRTAAALEGRVETYPDGFYGKPRRRDAKASIQYLFPSAGWG